jgi:hypothetical protein
MSAVPQPRLTYANVTATLALFLALGGGAYAATALPARSVGPRELKANAVTRAKIKRNAVDGSKVLDGSLRGADIKESTLGPVPAAVHALGATALDKVTYKSATGAVGPDTNPANPTVPAATGTVACDAGQHAVSGGAKVDAPASAFVVDSFPDAGGTAWTVRVGNTASTPVGFTVIAICTTVTAIG